MITIYQSLTGIFVHVLDFIGPLGELWVVLPVAAALAVWCLLSGERRGALAFAAVTVATLATVVLMKLIATAIGPPWRPHWDWISNLFPSGHLAMGTVVYGTLAVCVGRAAPRLGAGVAATVAVLLVLLGIERVVDGAHPILDVLGGAALGGVGLMALLRLWPGGRLHPAGLPGVAVAAALVLHIFYGRQVPSVQILQEMLARIHILADAVKAGWAGY